ncbi:hypothetical protein H257_17474 [Aphanomyces astaci]|uniref:Uncharacterized protein n=1 Tax=Aphanomyces astaci TaxID=112090 RepID=W4FEM0_APHAT|nr:hypothetical protein H257_17474 [Aphanomyces astaci]ETV65925.1 hypothetical protein H257_17474 [Aphanomyces astaci]|eukprot:XP_009844580.1 hypothetical protein H257_17474 [Aphanomyces astaci]
MAQLSGDDVQLCDDLRFAIAQLEPDALEGKSTLEIQCLADVYSIFGYGTDDIVDKRDQIVMFTKIRTEMMGVLHQMTTKGRYAHAIVLRDRLRLIRREFIHLQQTYEKRRQDVEGDHFLDAIALVRTKHDAKWVQKHADVDSNCDWRREDLAKTHMIQTRQLEDYLDRIHEPIVKFSKTLLDLKTSERNLSKLQLYEQAKNVYTRADAMEKVERLKNTQEFHRHKQKQREDLRAKQHAEQKQLEEALTDKQYATLRAKDWDTKRESQRVKNLKRDMHHAHALDQHKPPEFTTHPLVAPRDHLKQTSSTFGGQHFLSLVRGERLQVQSLCALHDAEEDAVPSGAVVYS